MSIATTNAQSAENKVAVQFDTLAKVLPDASKHLRLATLSLRSAFTVADANIEEFKQLRRSIVLDATAYRLRILPVAKQSTFLVKEYMDYFQTLELSDILDIVDELSADAKAGEVLMTVCKDMHMAVSASFKQKQDRIDNVLSTCNLQKQHYLDEAKRLREEADTKEGWAIGLAFIPIVGLFASPILGSQAVSDRAKAAGAAEEAQLAVNATYVIQDCLVGALEGYMQAMDLFASTFQLLAGEIAGFLQNLDKFKATEKASFYKMCNKKAKTVMLASDTYLTAAIEAESDLMSLPECDDLNYVQKWLETHTGGADGKSFRDRLSALGTSLPKTLKDLVH